MNRKVNRIEHSTTYEVNGVRYSRLEDVPAELRKHFMDNDGNGIPDVIDAATDGLKTITTTKVTNINMNDGALVMSPELKRLLRDGTQSSNSRLLVGALRDFKDIKIECCQCGYDLTGTAVGSKCPECGTDVRQSIQALVDRSSPSKWLGETGIHSSHSRWALRELRRFLTSIVAVAMLLGFMFLIVKCSM